MSLRYSRWIVAAALLVAARIAAADETARSSQSESNKSSPHVRASHRVEVIAPGEKVDTVIDRMRIEQPVPVRAVEGKSGAKAPSVPDRREFKAPVSGVQESSSSVSSGISPPATLPSPPGDGPPPERPRR